ncbi:MAG TPA: hypothetical protein VH589_27705 [Trebonia sp.]
MGAVLPRDPRVRECAEEASRTVEVWQVQVCRADAVRVVGVRACRGGNAEFSGHRRGFLVQRLVADLGVEDLDDVRAALGAQGRQRPAQAGPALVEWVRHVHQAALVPDPSDNLGQRQHVRDPLRQEQADHVADRCPDLLSYDDPDVQVAACRRLGGRHGGRSEVVVGDAHRIQAGAPGLAGQLLDGEHRIPGRDGVHVAVEPHPAGRGAGSGNGRLYRHCLAGAPGAPGIGTPSSVSSC